MWGIVYLCKGCARTSIQINGQLHTFFVLYRFHSGVGWKLILKMNAKYLFELLFPLLEDDCIEKFKVGITNDIDTREKQYQANGYTVLIHIASGDNTTVKALESELINLLKNKFPQKCENLQIENEGNAKKCNKVYIAIKIINPIDITTLQIIRLLRTLPLNIDYDKADENID